MTDKKKAGYTYTHTFIPTNKTANTREGGASETYRT